jgi:hypothetical protein
MTEMTTPGGCRTAKIARADKRTKEQPVEVRINQQVGVLVADSLEEPWQRSDAPAIGRNPLPGKWDSSMATNPSPGILP